MSRPSPLRPFHVTHEVKRTLVYVVPILVVMWIVLFVLFRQELSVFSDESGYHEGGILLADAIRSGQFFELAFDNTLFRYPGYYMFAGVIYFLLGPNHLILRALGFAPYFLIALCVSNIAAALVGEQARRRALLIALAQPVFIVFAMQLLRDIYIALTAAVIFHGMVLYALERCSVRDTLTSPYLIVAYLFLFLLRTPQAALMLSLHFLFLLLLAPLRRGWKLALLVPAATFIGISSSWLPDLLMESAGGLIFEHSDRVVSMGHLRALSEYTFSSPREMFAALRSPSFVAISMVAKVSFFFLGPHPFLSQEGGASLLSLFGQFDPVQWGGFGWIDVLLVYGLQWIPMFLLLPFSVLGCYELARTRRQAFVVIVSVFVFYSVITLFASNEIRWGLPTFVVYCLLPAVGLSVYWGRMRGFVLGTLALIMFTVTLRVSGVLKVPMIFALVPPFLVLVFDSLMRVSRRRDAASDARRSGRQLR